MLTIIAIVIIFFALLPTGKGIKDTATHLAAAEQTKDNPEESAMIADEGIRKGGRSIALIIVILFVGVMTLAVAAMSGDPRMVW